ncbi:hypothetical protein GCM10020001_047620 [Nonomuraea salmonea]
MPNAMACPVRREKRRRRRLLTTLLALSVPLLWTAPATAATAHPTSSLHRETALPDDPLIGSARPAAPGGRATTATGGTSAPATATPPRAAPRTPSKAEWL